MDKQFGIIAPNKISIEAQKQQEKEIRFLGSIIPHSGHICYELNLKTLIISKAKFMPEVIEFKDGFSKNKAAKKKSVMVDKECIYASALNKKNAAKHFGRMLGKKVAYDSTDCRLIIIS
jgi:hypothetical protein